MKASNCINEKMTSEQISDLAKVQLIFCKLWVAWRNAPTNWNTIQNSIKRLKIRRPTFKNLGLQKKSYLNLVKKNYKDH